MTKNKINNKKSGNKTLRENIILFVLPLILLTLTLFIATAISVAADLQKSFNFPIFASLTGLCSLLSGFLAGRTKRENGIFTGIIYPLPTFLIYILLSLITNSFSFDFNLLISLAVMLISSAVGGILGVNTKKKIRRGRK